MNSQFYGYQPASPPPGMLAGQQLAPQGVIGDALGQLGGPLGGWIGGRFGNQGLGQQIGGIAGQLGRLLPFEAGPQGYDPYAQYQQQAAAQLAPQGFFGDLLGQVGAPLGGAIGGRFGNRGLGQQIGGIAGQLGRLLPFEAGPQGYDPYAQYQAQDAGQLAPQGFFGNLLGQVGAPLGGAIGGRFGNRGLGQQIGGIAGQLGRLLPFEAGPQGYDPYAQYQAQDAGGQLAPQGFFGDAIGQLAGPVGGWIGGRLGNRGLGQQVGGIAGQLGRLLPFEAGPQGYDPYAQYQQQDAGGQLAPQGFFGDLASQFGGQIGGAIGGRLGNRGLGQQVGGIAGQLGRLLPFEAGPQGYDPYGQYQQQAAAQLAPQGFIGDAIGQIAGPVGGWIGGRFGNRGLGQQVGGIAGQLGRLLPFEAGPQGYDPYAQVQQQDANGQLAPQGFFGGLAGSVLGGLGGGAIGRAFGNRNLGQNIGRIAGGALGTLLPFEAGPQGLGHVPIYQNYGYPGSYIG